MTLIEWFKSALFIFLGLFIGLFITRIPLVTLDPSVDIAELGNLVLILVLAFLVPIFLTKTLDNKRYEKNLLISELDAFRGALLNIDSKVKALSGKTLSQDDFTEITSSFKTLRSNFILLSEQIESFNCKEALSKTKQLDTQITKYWDVLTGIKGVKPAGFKITPPFIWRQSTVHTELNRKIRELSFIINKN